jgi:DNA-binding NarL/FixJ family response regulator
MNKMQNGLDMNDWFRNSFEYEAVGTNSVSVPWPIGGIAHGGSTCARPFRLTARQSEILTLISTGLPTKLISRRLNISAGTVKAHISAILRELGVANRLQAVLTAQRHGLLPGVRMQQTR